MKTNSELPLSLLQDLNQSLNDYDFVLFNLYISNEEYREYYKRMRQDEPDRLMIMDNSAYELYKSGKSLDLNAYRDAILDLQPDIYIVPDTLMNMTETLQKAQQWQDLRKDLDEMGILPMYVAQGSTFDEMIYCAMEYCDTYKAECVAVPFHNSFFKEIQADPQIENEFIERMGKMNEDMRYAMGRIQFLSDYDHVFNRFKYVHLLGSHHPLEKHFYNGLPWIKSMDTSYPVKCALEGYVLFNESHKPDSVIDDWLTQEIDPKTRQLIVYNVQKFKLI